jgi:hypothetical protein
VFNAGMHADVQPCRAGVRHLRRARAGRRALLAGVGSLVDVAGGMGAAAKAIARAFPHVKVLGAGPASSCHQQHRPR